MAYSSGTFSRLYDWTTDRDAGVKIRADRMDEEFDGIATGLTTAILKDGTQTTTAVVPFAFGISIVDNKAITLGTNSDITIQYDETTNDSLEIAAATEGAALGIVFKSDQGDDNADQHKLSIADGGTLTLASKISGSFVTYLTHTPNSTVASSTLAVAGNLTVGGNLTLGSGAELSEAELEMLDGITAGTVAASKAVVVDSNKDIASFRNITLTGELDAGSLDVSGDADIDGTLEADAITVGGTALNTVIAGVTVTNATTAAVATTVTISDNESTNEENAVVFTAGGDVDGGNIGLESDGDLTYNPSTGTVTATVFKGNIDAVDGDFDGTLEADAITIGGTGIGSIYSAIAGSSNIVTTGALNSGSITSGFGAINNGSSNITTTGVGTFASLDISGDIDVDGTANLDVVDIDGAVDMATSLTVGGATTFNGTVAGTAMTLLATTTVSSAVSNVTFSSSLITDTYMDYRVTIRFAAPATNGQALFVHPSDNNGSDYDILIEQHMQYHDLKASLAFGNAGTNGNSGAKVQIGTGTENTANKGLNADIMFIGLRQTTGFKAMHFNCIGAHDNDGGHNTGNDYWWQGGAKFIGSSNTDRTAINNLKFQFASGNVAQGTFSLYGIKS